VININDQRRELLDYHRIYLITRAGQDPILKSDKRNY